MSTPLKLTITLLGSAMVLGLACKKPEPVQVQAPAKVDTSREDQAKRDEEARRQAEAARQRAEQAKAEAARKAVADQEAQFRVAAAKALQDIPFAFDQAALSEPAKTTLQGVADFLKQYPKAALQLEGHCDERGTGEYNLALGERRASAVRDYLQGLGAQAGQLTTTTYGKEKPVCTESTEACWSRNRRVHFLLK
jgi:peptidoglycan-associated lipoprotein